MLAFETFEAGHDWCHENAGWREVCFRSPLYLEGFGWTVQAYQFPFYSEPYMAGVPGWDERGINEKLLVLQQLRDSHILSSYPPTIVYIYYQHSMPLMVEFYV